MVGVNWLYVMMFLELLATEMGCTFENPKGRGKKKEGLSPLFHFRFSVYFEIINFCCAMAPPALSSTKYMPEFKPAKVKVAF